MKTILSLLVALMVTTASFSQGEGANMFDDNFVHTIELQFDDPNFWSTMTTHYNDMAGQWGMPGTGIKQYIPAQCTFDGTVIDSVGVRQKGNFSNWGADGLKKPLKIDFNEFVAGTNYDGIKKVNLSNGFQDPSMMRDVMAYKMMREFGVPAPRTTFAKVYLNGDYWGLYILVEQVNKNFMEEHFADKSGNIFKCIDNTSLEWQGNNKEDYKDEFELKTNETEDDWTKFLRFVDNVNNTPSAAMKDSLDNLMHVGGYLNTLVVDVLLLNWDSYYDHGRNFYMYEDPTSGVFHWIPWDYNLAFSSTDVDIDLTQVDSKPLNTAVLGVDEYKEIYHTRFCWALENVFKTSLQENYINAKAFLIRGDLDDDPNKFFTIDEFDTNINSEVTTGGIWGGETFPGITDFIDARRTTVMQELTDKGISCADVLAGAKAESNISDAEVFVYPNPVTDRLYIQLPEEAITLQVFDAQGKLVYEMEAVSGLTRTQVDVSSFAKGVYYLTLAGEQTNYSKKVVKR